MATSFAFKSTKFTLDVASKLIKANVRVNNTEAIADDMSIIFVVNHFTRLETLLLPYEFYKQTGRETWSLAASDLFKGRIGTFLRSLGTISTKDPDRDRVIVRSLLNGEHPWLIFPEGSMIKDKKLIDAKGMFQVFHRGSRRAPHSGAAVLALRAEFYRHKLACIRDNPKLRDNGAGAALEHFGLDSFEETESWRTVIIPVNITYFPIRARRNVFLKLARAFAKNLSERAFDELSVEGSILGKGSDIDITLGNPIDVCAYLQDPQFAEMMACSDNDMDKLEADPRSMFNEAARDLMQRYMRSIYDLTTINFDHIFATMIRHQTAKEFTERAYRNRIFLCTDEIIEDGRYRLHDLLRKNYREILYEDANPHFRDFIELAIKEKHLEKAGDRYKKNFDIDRGASPYHQIRSKEVTYVIANEIEPLDGVTAIIKKVARTSREKTSRRIHEKFLALDLETFERDYAEHFDHDQSKPTEIGRPFLLKPKSPRAGIVLVHGYMAAPREVLRLAEFLYEKGYAVYAVRLKGHGTSPQDLADTTWEEWYESLNHGYTIIKTITDRIIIGGFSTGGGLALLAAARKRAHVEACFSINAPLELRHYAANLIPSVVAVNTILGRIGRRRREWEYVDNEPENAHINYTINPVKGIKQLGETMDVMEKELRNICSPTLIIQGARDPVVDPASGRLIFAQVGTSEKELIVPERARHGIINGTGAEDIFNHVDYFLEWARRKREARSILSPPA